MAGDEEVFSTIQHYTGVDLPQDGRYRGKKTASAILFYKVWERAVIIHGMESKITRDGERAQLWIKRIIMALDPTSSAHLPTVPESAISNLADSLTRFIREVESLKVLMAAYQEVADDLDHMDLLA